MIIDEDTTAVNHMSRDKVSLPTFPKLLTSPNTPFIHRDLSWLQFNERVLAEAQLESNPLLERIKFLAISSVNLDEFFMIRYPSLLRSIQNASHNNKQAALRLLRIRNDILEETRAFTLRQANILDILESHLDSVRIHLDSIDSDSEPQSHETLLEEQLFDEEIFPKLPAPEPFTAQKLSTLENLQTGILLDQHHWFRIPKSIPSVFFRWDEAQGNLHSYFLDLLVIKYLGKRYGTQGSPLAVRLTRDSDFTVEFGEEDTESVPDRVRISLGSRERGRPTRLQYLGNPKRKFLSEAAKALKLVSSQIIETTSTLSYHGLSTLQNHVPETLIQKFHLSHPPLRSVIPIPFRNPKKIFDHLDREDLLLHHPYDSFTAFEDWIRAACEDPSVVQIEQTVYRTDTLSPLMESFKKAAASKKIRVVIELRARFDELNNLRLAEELKKAGVEVSFGFGRLKLHGKVSLITRMVDQQVRQYAHLSTGNYKASTARQYTDLSILTSHPEICSDIRYFFDRILAGQVPQDFKQLIPAPAKLHRRLLGHIDAEILAAEQGRPARIFAKVNALVDDMVIQHLYRASQAGVQVDLIVRGACSLVPGVKGLSENIRVLSIVDRFLEHSRIYHFGDAQVIYLSSADWMPRNFFSRLEIAFPVLDLDIYHYIQEVIIPVSLGDTVKARMLTPEGKWKRCKPSPSKTQKPIRSQFNFEELAVHGYQGTALWKKGQGI